MGLELGIILIWILKVLSGVLNTNVFYEEIESINAFRELDVQVAIVKIGIHVTHGVEYFVVGVKVLASSFHHHAFYKIIFSPTWGLKKYDVKRANWNFMTSISGNL